MPWQEMVGYAGSVLVAASLTMNSVVRLRWLNLTGAVVFSVYGLLVGAYPVLAVNGFIAVVNVWYLTRMSRQSEYFELLEIKSTANRYLNRFLEFHAADIERYFPGFDLRKVSDPTVVLILRDMQAAGLLVCAPGGDGTLGVEIDYVIPQYRDLKCARFFYRCWGPVFARNGFRRFAARTAVPAHARYLRRVGYRPDPACSDCYEMPIAPPEADDSAAVPRGD